MINMIIFSYSRIPTSTTGSQAFTNREMKLNISQFTSVVKTNNSQYQCSKFFISGERMRGGGYICLSQQVRTRKRTLLLLKISRYSSAQWTTVINVLKLRNTYIYIETQTYTFNMKLKKRILHDLKDLKKSLKSKCFP